MGKLARKRVVLKISGEGLCRPETTGIDAEELQRIAAEIRTIVDQGVQLALVVGGGNIVRGNELAQKIDIPAASAHYMGMLGTIINALAVQEVLESLGIETRVQSAISVTSVAENFVRRRAIRHLEKGRVVIFAGGTGNPFVTTDTCAALRASEIGADVLFKATKVDGIYSADPKTHPDAVRHDQMTYNDFIDGRLKVMDLTAIVMCQENRIPVVVFNVKQAGNMLRVVRGERVGTLVSEQANV